VVTEYLNKEISLGRVVGPFPKHAIPVGQISRFGVIPKSHQPNSWRLIFDLSYPKIGSINEGIPSKLCSIKYVTIDDAINSILAMGPYTLMAKIDIKSAFRLLPVHPADRHLLLMQWDDYIFVDTCIPFGLRSAPKLFNVAADLLQWMAEQTGVSPLFHYLDDFLLLGPAQSHVCLHNLNQLKLLCQNLGIPLALEKVSGPTTSLAFLGIVIDTVRMEARLPEDKLARIQQLLATWLTKKNATKREILSLVGHLQHAAKVIKSGRTFVSRMYATAAKVKELDFYTRLNRGFRSDLSWWHTFMVQWNGLSLLRYSTNLTTFHYSIQTDASGSWGCGAVFQAQWLQLKWDRRWASMGIMAKELVPIVLATAVWGPRFAKSTVLFQCDNFGVVSALRKGSAKEKTVMHLLRCLWFFVAYYDIEVLAEHIPGISNPTADHLSRCKMSAFFRINLQASPIPTAIPTPLLHIVNSSGPDWSSSKFRKYFKNTVEQV